MVDLVLEYQNTKGSLRSIKFASLNEGASRYEERFAL